MTLVLGNYSSPSNSPSVGLCPGCFSLRFLVEGSARVGGGVPIFSRARAFTADAALKGLGLRRFAAISVARAVRILSALLQDSVRAWSIPAICAMLY